MTIVCCCADSYESYYPMQSACDEDSYEADRSKFTAGIAERIIEGSAAMLRNQQKR